MDYIAHVRSSDHAIQTVKEHLLDAQELAEKWGNSLRISKVCGLAALLHDLGKYSDAFQDYIRRATAGEKVTRGEVDHATAGGRLLFDMLKGTSVTKQLLAEIVSNAIISHHGNLHDYVSGEESPFLKRVEMKALEEYELCKYRFFDEVMFESDLNRYVESAHLEMLEYFKRAGQNTSVSTFLTKFIFSVLLDADRTNTRQFETNQPEYTLMSDFTVYMKRLEDYISHLGKKSSDTPINLLRQQMSDQCREHAKQPSGIYTLSIPTGGGKTLASLRYALHHSILYNKQRIIYVVPFTTIIEQNAQVTRDVLNTQEVVEHHSNVIQSDNVSDDEINLQAKLNLAKDNWDAPIIFTTMVQYLNTFYAKGNRNTRRMHHLSDAVIIFDEVQKVPTKCVSLFNESLNYLKTGMNTSVLLCTATQPALDFVKRRLVNDGEIISNLLMVSNSFKRTELEVLVEEYDTEKLSVLLQDRAAEHKSILVILNTKPVVRKLYESLKTTFQEEELFHLSTSMCAAHRKDLLKRITERLKANKRVVCISTQLIEAGVDVSFPCVIRSYAGLDSIAQAAGRCNRHGELEISTVYVVNHIEEDVSKLTDIEKGQQIVKRMIVDLKRDLSAYDGDLLSPAAMRRYFTEFYQVRESELDYPIKTGQCLAPMLFEMSKSNDVNNPLLTARHRTVADHFQVIDQATTDVLVPYTKQGAELIAHLNGEISWEQARQWLKESQQYSIGLYAHEIQSLERTDSLMTLLDGQVLALHESAYDKQFGLNLSQDSEMQNLMI
ncbi:CRISPR-associated helicase/endonuclease Cas3 [Exiguobacterium sp. NG55]|uniref:CRISPR-associated helicase/endonuclease Cas3 n=1 Tax=Exiguobacterium sp. NG55 TaxID=375477 RepID=UPI0004DEDF77|nr:CRISPR-associated helicase/endonuclease Cas3 [Exiguobacterium sp. NG55]